MFDKFFDLLKSIPKKFSQEIVIVQNDRFSDYPSNGLTPQRLAAIFREADNGEVMRQMELFEEMEEKDPHLFSQLQTRKNAVTGLDYEIIPSSDEEADKQIAQFVSEQLEAIDDFEDVMTDILDAIGKGISFTEIIWEFNQDFKFIIKDLKYKHPKHFFWDDKDILKVRTDINPEGIELPEHKFIIHKYKAKSGHPSRAGILRVVAWMYLFKNYDVKDWVSFCEVFGMPLRVGKYAPDANEDEKRSLMQALINLGTDAAGIYPNTSDIQIIESNKQSSADIYERLARFCDEQTSKAILGQTLTSDSGGGSYAQSKTHDEVRHDLTIADCKALARTIRRDLITPLVRINYGLDAKIPTMKFDCEESEDLVSTAEMYSSLINEMGLQISTSHIYKKFGIPKPEIDDDIAKGRSQNTFGFANKMIANKDSPKIDQSLIDSIAEYAINQSGVLFAERFKPVQDMINNCTSLEEIKMFLETDTSVASLLNEMDNNRQAYFLANSMMLADLAGRMAEDG